MELNYTNIMYLRALFIFSTDLIVLSCYCLDFIRNNFFNIANDHSIIL